MQQYDVSCLHIHCVSLYHFIGELSPLICRDIREQWLSFPVIFVPRGG
ncbi:rCG49580, partial [Rattus norvegicus]